MPKKRDRALKLFNFDIIPEQCQMINIFKIFDLVIFYNSFYTYKRKKQSPSKEIQKLIIYGWMLLRPCSGIILHYTIPLLPLISQWSYDKFKICLMINLLVVLWNSAQMLILCNLIYIYMYKKKKNQVSKTSLNCHWLMVHNTQILM